MERFVQLVVAGGIALVAGLWVLQFFATMATGWLVGAGLVAIGVVGLAGGIWSEIEY